MSVTLAVRPSRIFTCIIDDQPSFLAGNGVPYEFTSFNASGPVDAAVNSNGRITFGPIGPQKPFTDDYPANNAFVTFK
jgi:hypothetical protein